MDNRLQSDDRLVCESWQRCRDYGLDSHQTPELTLASPLHWQQKRQLAEVMVSVTREKVLPGFQSMLANSSSLVILTDHEGYLLERWGNPSFMQQMAPALFEPGACWQEKVIGTNAIGTALHTQQITDIRRDEHFLLQNRFMNASASPIVDPHRQIVGVLNVSSDAYLPTTQVHGMVKVMSQAIENQLILAAYGQHFWQFVFNTSPDNLGSQWAGLLVFDFQGQIVSANRRADLLLGKPLAGITIDMVAGMSLQALMATQQDATLTFSGLTSFPLFARINAPAEPSVTAPSGIVFPRHAARETPQCEPSLTDLDTGDKQMAKAVHQAMSVLNSDIPLLIHGETGVGKERFVRAFHASSHRAAFEMVAVNCAAIPSELVESELFGYVKGAFTGANPKGSMGLIRCADKGTLFLDEIGDMPLPTQARLLRVLQEKRVTPLGSSESYPVDFQLVCATHQSLRDEIKARQFREDLYYRINGLTVALPALRDRQDMAQLVLSVLDEVCDGDRHVTVSDEVMQLFDSHNWPGNIRQLHNVLRVATVLAAGKVIEPQHLPDDFFWDLKGIARIADDIDDELLEEDWQTALPKVYMALGRNVSKTAEAMSVSRNTVYKRLKQLGLWHDG
ncbi:sigma-54-dependent Fis family transcriptional regulator [Photobacterium sp. CAU 1568]|uniref:Sigma-54-dependent Fis family transcriptional regulator n=1 Tax=Photobacterium arenosum TaxID=2774143 RepID=A0ABR9BPL1_9GAMM|nr:sigma-54-dependent Fis family transcriptional regulator [Photobacterium arenosum]MBD8513532.1 sigma-54-dependent Fis family transcriptional regulator [Photobacterium arenosum]